jgi:hypothetical protein
MSTQDAIPPGYRRGLTACPVCDDSEHVIAVPAVFESSSATEDTLSHAKYVLNDDDSSIAKKRAARETLATTVPAAVRSKLLAPAPRAGTPGCFLFGCVFFALPAVALRYAVKTTDDFTSSDPFLANSHPEDQTLMTLSNVAIGLVVLCALAAVIGYVRRRSVQAGRPAADAIWRKGWYCTRCAVVHFAPGEEPEGVSAGQALDPDSFRRLVWTAGGYGNRFRPGS